MLKVGKVFNNWGEFSTIFQQSFQQFWRGFQQSFNNLETSFQHFVENCVTPLAGNAGGVGKTGWKLAERLGIILEQMCRMMKSVKGVCA